MTTARVGISTANDVETELNRHRTHVGGLSSNAIANRGKHIYINSKDRLVPPREGGSSAIPNDAIVILAKIAATNNVSIAIANGGDPKIIGSNSRPANSLVNSITNKGVIIEGNPELEGVSRTNNNRGWAETNDGITILDVDRITKNCGGSCTNGGMAVILNVEGMATDRNGDPGDI